MNGASLSTIVVVATTDHLHQSGELGDLAKYLRKM